MSKKIIILVVLGISFVFGIWLLTTNSPYNPLILARPLAIYKNFRMQGNPEFFKFSTSHGKGIAGIYVELPDKQRYFLPDLPESAAAKLMPKKSIDIAGPPHDIDYMDVESMLSFREGKLVLASLYASSKKFRISAHKNGPYFDLPISKRTLIEEFGQPLEWQVAPEHSHGP